MFKSGSKPKKVENRFFYKKSERNPKKYLEGSKTKGIFLNFER